MKASWVLFRKKTSFISSILVRVILASSWVIQESMSLIKGPLSLCLKLIFYSLKCNVYQFPFHLLLCFHFLVLNNFSNFLLVSIPTMIDQSNESNLVDSHHFVFGAWLSRFWIRKEVYYTKCLTEGHPCLVAFYYGSENNVVS